MLYGLVNLIQDRVSDKITDDCAVDFYFASFEVGASVLCSKCASYLLSRYHVLYDSEEKQKALLHIVNNMALSSQF